MSEEKEKKDVADIVEPDVKESKNVNDSEYADVPSDMNSSSIAPSVDSAVDLDAITKAKIDKSKGEKKSNFKFPKLFIKKEELVEVEIDILFDGETGDVYSITQSGIVDSSVLSALECATYTFKFRPISYDDMQKYRRQSSFYDSKAGDLIINRLLLRNLILANHLCYTDAVDENGESIDLKIDESTGNLDLESLNKISRSIPALMDVVMTLFERKLLMVFEMGK